MITYDPIYLQDRDRVKRDLRLVVENYLKRFADLKDPDTGKWLPYSYTLFRLLPFTSGREGYERALKLLEYLNSTSDKSAEIIKYVFNESGYGDLHRKLVKCLHQHIMDADKVSARVLPNFDRSPTAVITSCEEVSENMVIEAAKNALEGRIVYSSAPRIEVMHEEVPQKSIGVVELTNRAA